MRGTRSLVGRVAIASALGFVLSGASVAVVMGVLADRLVRVQEDTHLRDSLGVMVLELAQPGADAVWIAGDETRELAHTSMRVAIFQNGRFLAGDRGVHAPAPGECESRGSLRACAQKVKAWTAVIARDDGPLRDHAQASLIAGLVAVALTALVSTLLAARSARVVVRPLRRLEHAVALLPAQDPSTADLGRDEGVREVDALRASLRTSLTQLGVALSQSRSFASQAAHQLRTPLTVMSAELELLAERGVTDDELVRARKIARRLASLVDRLLILARRDAARVDAAELDALDLLEDAIDSLPAEDRARVRYAPESLPVRGDATLLVAMLENALENALKFSTGPVDVTFEARGDVRILRVKDAGPGIPEAERERVFSPFYRVRSVATAQVPGHGLGLALIAHVVALHGGRARFLPSETGAVLELELG